MREIKAWDKRNKQMKKVWAIDYQINEVELSDKFDGYWTKFEDVILLQYTGLKDKNGVKIYEGDIISYTMLRFNGVGYETEEEYGVVEYGDAVFEIDGVPLYVAHAEDDEIEIIGNVYSSPELLETN